MPRRSSIFPAPERWSLLRVLVAIPVASALVLVGLAIGVVVWAAISGPELGPDFLPLPGR